MFYLHKTIGKNFVRLVMLCVGSILLIPVVSQAASLTHGNYDIENSVFVDSFSVAPNDIEPTGLEFSVTGDKMYTIGISDYSIDEYDLSTPFDPTTATYVQTAVVGSANIVGVEFSNDGSKLFVVNYVSNRVEQFTLVTNYDVSTIGASGGVFSFTTQDIDPYDVEFNADGSVMFMVGTQNNAVYEYSLGTNYDITTASFTGTQMPVGLSAPRSMSFNSDGTVLLVVSDTVDTVRSFNLSTPYDLTTAVIGSDFVVPNAQDNTIYGIEWDGSGSNFFVLGRDNDSIFRFRPSAVYDESVTNDGSVVSTNEYQILINGDTFQDTDADDLLDVGTEVILAGVPTGLTPVLTLSAADTIATLTFTGNANLHQNINDVADITFSFDDTAFSALAAASITNATGPYSTFGILDFNDNPSFGVTIEQAAAQVDPTTAPTALYTVTFSSAINNATFTTADIDVTTSTAPGVVVDSITEVAPHDGTTFEVQLSATGAGDFVASLPLNAVSTATFNVSQASTSTDNTITTTYTPPAPVSSGGGGGAKASTRQEEEEDNTFTVVEVTTPESDEDLTELEEIALDIRSTFNEEEVASLTATEINKLYFGDSSVDANGNSTLGLVNCQPGIAIRAKYNQKLSPVKISELQEFLNEQGETLRVTGLFHNETIDAVKRFQGRFGLPITGEWAPLDHDVASAIACGFELEETNFTQVACVDTFTIDLRQNQNNSASAVESVQRFLESELAAVFPAYGYYGPITARYVSQFHEKYATEILAPINANTGTGVWASLSRSQANKLVCSSGTTEPAQTPDMSVSDSSTLACEPVFATEIRLTTNNLPIEVEKVQRFLESEVGATFATYGEYGPETARYVSQFHEKYAADILAPISATAGTGIWANNSIKKANELSCQN